MKKTLDYYGLFKPNSNWHKLLLTMKISAFLLFCCLANIFAAPTYSQATKISLHLKDTSIEEVLNKIEDESEFYFLYNQKLIDVTRKVNIDADKEPIIDILNEILNNDTKFIVYDRQIILTPSDVTLISTAIQQLKITGTVVDKDGAPLPGVNVVVTGTTQGAITDIAGKYSIEVPPGSKNLTFSFIGMEPQEITIGTLTQINITMAESAIGLEEVVVVGYGSQKKRDIIGSISTIKSNVIETATGSSNFNSLLQGQAAGVSVQSTSGRLGADVDIKIRGLSSISAGTSPLWIIDGVPIQTGIDIGNDGSAPQSPMSLINQSDIESIQVLKDAAATSIYGSRGSNGVILITTKSGTTGKATMNLDFSAGISDLPSQRMHFLNTTQWLRIKDEAKQAYGLGTYNMSDVYDKRAYATEFLTREQAEVINTDWRKETMRQGNFQNLNFSTVGGDKAVRYYLSGNYRTDKSVMKNEDLKRYGVRANIDLKPLNSLEIGTKMNLSLSKGNRGKNDQGGVEDGNENGTGGGFSFVNSATVPFEPVYSLANPLLYYNPLVGNPVATSDRANLVESLEIYRVLTSVYGEYHLPYIEGLSARTEASIDFIQSNRNFWVSDVIRQKGSLAQDNASTSKSVQYKLYLKYSKVFGEHALDLVGGAEFARDNTWYRSMQGENLIGTYQQLGTPTLLTNMFSGLNGEGYGKSYFGRANYKFKDKYLAGISMRRDGSSVFTPDFRWGNFFAFSAGWILSDESFMGKFGKSNFLKIRGSFGQTGNASIPGNLDVTNFSSGLAYGSQDILGLNGTLVSSIGVTNLRWETTNNMDIGLDFGFFNHRIDGSIAYYNKYVKGLLLASTIPPSSGVGSIWGNIGDLVNSGIEFSVTSSNLESRNLKWQTTLNIAFNHNEVKKLTPKVDMAGTGMVEMPYINKVGYGVRDYFLADFAGINSETGLGQIYALDQAHYTETGETQRLKDEQGNDILLLATNANSNTNRFHLKGKNGMPTYYGGISNKFTYKGFDLGFLITFSGGNYILDTFIRGLVNPNANGEMLADFDQNYWKNPGDKAKYQRLDWKGNVKMDDGTTIGLGDSRTWNNQFLFKGDYVKLKSINFGYTLPFKSERKLLQTLRIYGTLENLYTLTKYPGWDPEGLGLVSQWDLPQLFSASIGVTIKF